MNIKDFLGDSVKDGMTAEELIELLNGTDVPVDKSSEVEAKYKSLISKANSEAADYKKQLKEKMTEDERKSTEEAEAQAKLQADYDALVKKVTISEHKAQFLGLGYDEKSANAAAEALFSGDVAKVFELQKAHQETLSKQAKADYIDSMPRPQGGTGTTAITKEQIMAIKDTQDRWSAIAEHPDLFPELGE